MPRDPEPPSKQADAPPRKPAPIPWGTIGEVRTNEDGTIDEVIAEGVSIHLEQLSDGVWWMRIDGGSGREGGAGESNGLGAPNGPGAPGWMILHLTTRRDVPIRCTATIDDDEHGLREVGFHGAGWKRKELT